MSLAPHFLLSMLVGSILLSPGLAQQPTPPPPTVMPAQRPRPEDQAALFRTMAAMTGLEAAFEEEKHLSLLALPLRSKGRLFFHREPRREPEPAPEARPAGAKAGGYLTRIVDQPEPSTVQITPDQLRVQNREGTEVVDLQRSDKVRTFILSLVHVFTGDEEALTKAYTVSFELDPGNTTGWSLGLVPRGKPLDQMMKSLRLFGEGEAVVRIEIHEPNGDRTVTRIVTANPARTFDSDEQKRLFGIDRR